MADSFLDGGAFVWLLLLCALLAVVVVADAVRRVTRAGRRADELLQRVDVLGREGRIEDVLRTARDLPGAVSAVVLAGLEHDAGPDEQLAERAMSAARGAEQERLARGVVALRTLAIVAPLLGLLGSALALGDLAPPPGAAPAGWTPDGVRAALLPLTAGLALGIPLVVALGILGARVARLGVDMERAEAAVLRILWDHGDAAAAARKTR